MAIYNEILAARFARFAQKLFSMKGSPPVRALAGELNYTLLAFSGVENRYLEGWERFGNATTQAAGGAGTTAAFRIRNPAGSNTVAVVEQLAAANNTGSDIIVVSNSIATNVDLANPISMAQLDSRSRANSSLIVSVGTPAAPALAGARNIEQRAITTIGQMIEFILHEDQEIPILPGMSLQIALGNPNQALLISIVYRERPLEQSELT